MVQETWVTKFLEVNLVRVHFRIIRYYDTLRNVWSKWINSAVTLTKKRSLTLEIKFKTRSAIINEGLALMDNEADYCCSQRFSWFFKEFSCSCKISKMLETSIKYPGVYQVIDQFFGVFSMVLNILTGI